MSIKNLTEISSLVTKSKSGKLVQSIDFESGGDSIKYLKLIDGLTRGVWKDDIEAALDIYGKPTGGKTFEMLKSRAKERLINSLFQSDTSKIFQGQGEKAYFNACKCYLSGSLLFFKDKLSSGQEQFKQAIKIARKFEYSEIELLSLRMLRRFVSFSGDERAFNKYNQEIKLIQDRLSAEMKSEELNQDLVLDVVKSVNLSETWMTKIKENYYEMREILKNHDSYIIQSNAYQIFVRYHQANEDYEGAIKVGLDYKKYLKGKVFRFIEKAHASISINNLYNCLNLRDYERGVVFAQECEQILKPNQINWLIFKEYHFLLCCHTYQFDKANIIYSQVIQNPIFDSYPSANVEKWRIFEAYLEYAKPLDVVGSKRKFNISKFLNEVPVFSKDKSGYNMSIIIAQILLSVKTQEWSKVIDRAEPLKTYLSRYVKKDRNPRSYYFLKLLEVMIRYEFHPEKTEQIGGKFFQKLQQSGGSVPESSEIIPYEWLWTDLLANLRQFKSNADKVNTVG